MSTRDFDLQAEPPPADPWAVFTAWYAEARASEHIRFAHAAVFATVDAEGLPDARTLLAHRFGPGELLVSTDTGSAKVRQLEANPRAALVFLWTPLDRQARFRGRVEKASDADSDFCFEERPRPSRLTAWASHQGPGLESRARLESAWEAAEKRFRGIEEIPRPPHWRAYRLVPETIELWQAGARRLHDRLLYRRDGEGWAVERLWP